MYVDHNLYIRRVFGVWIARLHVTEPVKHLIVGHGRTRREAIANWKNQYNRVAK